MRKKFNIDEEDPTTEYPADYRIFDDIEKTFEDLSEDKVLTAKQKVALSKFSDLFIICSLNNEEVFDIVSAVLFKVWQILSIPVC